MNIVYRDINDLISAEYNPRQLTNDQFNQISDSIKRFGIVDPIIVNKNKEREDIIIGGHQRIKVAKDLNIEKVPTVELDLNYDKERELNIRLNKNSGDWDYDVLANGFEMDELMEWGFSEDDLVGFAPEEEEEVVEGLTDDDAIPEDVEPVCNLGDLYQLGEHRLLCGDATIKEDVDRLMDGSKVELLHADPPYGMGKEKDGVLNDNLYNEKLDEFQMEWWSVFRPYLKDNGSAYIWGNAPDLWRLWWGSMAKTEKLTMRNEIVWNKGSGMGQNSDLHRQYATTTERILFFMIGQQQFGNVNADDFYEGFEPILNYLKKEFEKTNWKPKDITEITGVQMYGHWFTRSQWTLIPEVHYKKLNEKSNNTAFKMKYKDLKNMKFDAMNGGGHLDAVRSFNEMRAYFNNTHDNMTDVWDFARVQGEERHGHATPKPIAIMERIIKSSSEKSVIEPFLGSGSTLIACEKTNRKCYGMELDPHYCDVIIKRWEDFTGQKAELIGKT